MSLRKDYIQRQFEEFGKVLALILGFKGQKDWENFENEIAKATQKFTNLEMNHIEQLTLAEFENEVLTTQKLSLEQKKILANLLFEKLSFHLEIAEDEKCEELKSKCITLYAYLKNNFTENEFDLDVHYKLSFLNKL